MKIEHYQKIADGLLSSEALSLPHGQAREIIAGYLMREFEKPDEWEGLRSQVPKLSTGMPSTLGSYTELATRAWGDNSEAVKFLIEKAIISKNGYDEIVLTDESQMMHLLVSLQSK